jgi:hypothetical protein
VWFVLVRGKKQKLISVERGSEGPAKYEKTG